MSELRDFGGNFLPSADGCAAAEILPRGLRAWEAVSQGTATPTYVFPVLFRLRLDAVQLEAMAVTSNRERYEFARGLRAIAAGRPGPAEFFAVSDSVRCGSTEPHREYRVRLARSGEEVMAEVWFEGERFQFPCSPGGIQAAVLILWGELADAPDPTYRPGNDLISWD